MSRVGRLPADVRPEAVAGQFYPEAAAPLADLVGELLAGAAGSRCPAALIAPHAGYLYSGSIAASAFRSLEGSSFLRVVVIGPSHYVALRGIALSGARAFSTPFGEIEVDRAAEEELLGHPVVHVDVSAHAREHSVEVELPFLQACLGEFQLVPLVVGEATPAQVGAVLDQAWTRETLVVVSSDLTHFLNYETARRRDRATADAIAGLERDDFRPDEACGAAAINGLVWLARRRGLAARTLDLRSSGDTAGPRDRVVGYGAWSFLAE